MQPYPNPTHFDNKYPSHYDPLKDERFTAKPQVKHYHGEMDIIAKPTVPRFCEREIRKYRTCVVANDQNQNVCQQEQDNIVAVCPQWALHNLKEKKLGLIKLEVLNNKRYREAMVIAPYNQGRTVADVPLRRWEDGTRENLRPDTLWADDRYVDITYEEVKAARERVQQRRKANPTPNRAELPHYDRTYEVPPKGVPLYPLE